MTIETKPAGTDVAAQAPGADAQGKASGADAALSPYALQEIKRATEQRQAIKVEKEALERRVAELEAKQSDDYKALAAKYRAELDQVKPEFEKIRAVHEEREKRMREQAHAAIQTLPERLRPFGEKLDPEEALAYVQTTLEELKHQPGPAANPAAASPDHAGRTLEQVAALGPDAVSNYLGKLDAGEFRKISRQAFGRYGS